MLGGVTCHMLPHLPGVPHLHVNRPLVLDSTENLCLSAYWPNYTSYPSYIKYVLIKQTATSGAVVTESWPLGWKWFDPMWLMISLLVTIESDYDQLQVYDMVEHKKNICRMRRFYQLKVDPPCLLRDQQFVFLISFWLWLWLLFYLLFKETLFCLVRQPALKFLICIVF